MTEQVQNTTAPTTTQSDDPTSTNMKRNLNESQSTDTPTQNDPNNVGPPPPKKQKLNETQPNNGDNNNNVENNNNNNNVDNSQNNNNQTMTSGQQPMQVDQQQEQKTEEGMEVQHGRYLTRTFSEIRKYLKTLPAEHLKKLAGDTILMQKQSFEVIRERMHLHPSLCKIFVRSLSYDTKEETVKNFFLQYGEIKEVCIVKDRDTGISRGFGFITYKNANNAIEALREHCKIIDNREVICNLAKPQGQKDRRRGRDRRGRGGRRRRGRGRRRQRGGFDEPMYDNHQSFFNTTYPGQPMQPMPPMPQMQPPVHFQGAPMQMQPMQMQPMQMQPMQPMQMQPMQPMQMQGPM